MMRPTGLAGLLIAVASLLPGSSRAELVTYEMTLTVNGITLAAPCSSTPSSGTFGCLSLGQTFRGTFSVDSSILGVDGINQTAAIYGFDLPFGALVYSTGTDNTALQGFRNPTRGASAPGFVVQGGQVVDWYGGVYGRGDIPFIDMYGSTSAIGRNQFSAYDGVETVTGSMVISSPAPEPETYAMFAGGLLMVGLARRLRHPGRRAVPA